MKIIRSIILISCLLSLGSCNNFLEEPPKIQADIQTIEQLEALINNATAFTYDGHNATAAYSTDDTEISQALYKGNVNAVSLENIYYYVFDVDQIVGAAADALWNGEYKKIFTANVVLSNLEKVKGSATLKNKIKADALFIRAYSYWQLANYYCLPYAAANLQSPGLPLKKTTDYEESLERATLQETYDFILKDINEARGLADNDVVATLRWRVSKQAIDAFLSRYYLFIGDYDNSIASANSALQSTTAQLVDYNTILPGNSTSYTNPAATLKYAELNDWAAVKFLAWKEFYYTRYAYTSAQWYLPSSSLLSLYDTTNDLRYSLLMIPNGGRRFSVITPSVFRYTFFNDGRYIPSGPTVAEVLLNKAEASARKNDLATALPAVNTLRSKRFKVITPLTAATPAEALTKILEERRRELPFAFRWFDIRRFSVNTDPSDDVTVTRNFWKVGIGTVDVNTPQTYILPVKSLRYMVPINGVELDASKGQIQQNKY